MVHKLLTDILTFKYFTLFQIGKRQVNSGYELLSSYWYPNNFCIALTRLFFVICICYMKLTQVIAQLLSLHLILVWSPHHTVSSPVSCLVLLVSQMSLTYCHPWSCSSMRNDNVTTTIFMCKFFSNLLTTFNYHPLPRNSESKIERLTFHIFHKLFYFQLSNCFGHLAEFIQWEL